MGQGVPISLRGRLEVNGLRRTMTNKQLLQRPYGASVRVPHQRLLALPSSLRGRALGPCVEAQTNVATLGAVVTLVGAMAASGAIRWDRRSDSARASKAGARAVPVPEAVHYRRILVVGIRRALRGAGHLLVSRPVREPPARRGLPPGVRPKWARERRGLRPLGRASSPSRAGRGQAKSAAAEPPPRHPARAPEARAVSRLPRAILSAATSLILRHGTCER